MSDLANIHHIIQIWAPDMQAGVTVFSRWDWSAITPQIHGRFNS